MAEDEQQLCDCGSPHIVTFFRDGKTYRECLACHTQFNPAILEMSVEEILALMDEGR